MPGPLESLALKGGDAHVFAPPTAFAQRAHIQSLDAYRALYAQSIADPAAFWGERARELTWHRPFTWVLDWQPPHARWFGDGELNASVNCLDRHLAERGDKPALIWEGEDGATRTLSYRALHGEVCRFANALAGLGVQRGDRVGIYLPLLPEAVVAMLACARLGATHSVVFGGFSSEALRDRLRDAGAKVLITADGGYRKGQVIALKAEADKALAQLPEVAHVVVVARTGAKVALQPGRDHLYAELMAKASPDHVATPVGSEHPLFILYTSGTTGKPKGIVHSTAGYLLQVALTSRWVFDLKEADVYWCTADVGWITGHSYVVYGPLAEGATVVLYEGALNHPTPARVYELLARHRVSILYTAPTAIRGFMRAGDQFLQGHDLSHLRLLGSVGEPINPKAWLWYHQAIGGGRCPIVDTWWQTETGAIAVAPLPGATPLKPGSACFPLPGFVPEVLDGAGQPVAPGQGGNLFLAKPWPAMLRGVHGDPARYEREYWHTLPGKYFTGDGARLDADGYLWVMGRIDDVLNVAGHRLGTAEIESALVKHPAVAEAAVVGRPDALKGSAVVAFVTLKAGYPASDQLKAELRATVQAQIGALARPDDIRFTDVLPKTRSGKIVRRLLREVAAGQAQSGDTSTLEDLAALSALREDG